MLVDLDPEMTRLFSANPLLTALERSLAPLAEGAGHQRRRVPLARLGADVFDFIVVDFPDPTNYSLGKLYTTVFFRALGHHLSERGAFVVQSTSPMFARKSFWCIDETIKQAGYRTFPYHAYVPSFGEWGFVMASRDDYTPPTDPAGWPALSGGRHASRSCSSFPSDMARVPMPANHLNDQVLVRTLESEWREISR